MIANTPTPPYYAVIFTSVRTPVDNDYSIVSEKMVELAQKQPGFLEGDVQSYFRKIPLVTVPEKIYCFVDGQVHALLKASGVGSGYVSGGWASANLSAVGSQIRRPGEQQGGKGQQAKGPRHPTF